MPKTQQKEAIKVGGKKKHSSSSEIVDEIFFTRKKSWHRFFEEINSHLIPPPDKSQKWPPGEGGIKVEAPGIYIFYI